MYLLTVEDVLLGIDKAIAEKGESFIYEDMNGVPAMGDAQCAYFHETELGEIIPGCLIGHILDQHKADFGLELHISENFSSIYDNSIVITLNGTEHSNESTAPSLDAFASPEAEAIAVLAQRSQDCGNTWGEARDEARRAASMFTVQADVQ